MITLYPYWGTRGVALAIVVATWCQVIFYLWHSAKTLNISITQLMPLKKLLVKFLVLLAVYLLLSLSLQYPSKIIKLVIAATFTTVAVMAGMWSYFKSLFNSHYGKDS
jgi:peptidoglycan biosynthesis protein MviN/MurJ (putative lipid II flippase)